MANPFDFNEVEAERQFEKSVIFGDDADLTKPSDFMKVSLAAARMIPDDMQDVEERRRDSLKMLSATSMGLLFFHVFSFGL